MKEHGEFKQTYGLDPDEYDRRYPSQKKKDLDKADYLRKKLEKDKELSHKEKQELTKLVRLLSIELSATESKYLKLKKSKPSRKRRNINVLVALVVVILLAIGAWEVRAYVEKRGAEANPTAATETSPPEKEPSPEANVNPQESTSSNSGSAQGNSKPLIDQDATAKQLAEKTKQLEQSTLCLNLNSTHYPKYQYALADSKAEYERNVAAIESDPQYQGSLHINKRRELIEAEQASWDARNAAARAVFVQIMNSGNCGDWL